MKRKINDRKCAHAVDASAHFSAFAIVTEVSEAVNIAQAMIADAQLAARAEVEAKHLTNCRSCQAAMVNWRIANPTATCVDAETHHRDVWETCETCVAEYTAWIESQDELHELSRLGAGYGHATNGDDHRWQNGGVK